MSGRVLMVKPVIRCNLRCHGCYETEILENRSGPPFDLAKVLEAVERERDGRTELVVHGGEPLLVPLGDLRAIFLSMDGPRQIQTNAVLVRDEHIAMFKELGVSVGTSLNGPADLNRDRWAGSQEATDRATAKVVRNIERLRDAGVSVAVICVLSQTNCGTDEDLDRLVSWGIDFGERLGVWSFRWNMLGGHPLALSPARAAEVYKRLARVTFEDKRRMWLPFREFVDNLWGLGVQPCWVSECDPYATDAVYAVRGDGSLGNCLRTSHGEGVGYLRDQERGTDLRGQILWQVPFEDGGCGGCKYFEICRGGCPGEAIDQDWRNKSQFCQMYLETYQELERIVQGLLPNFTPVTEWTTNDKQGLWKSIHARRPLISPVNPMDSRWSEYPSSWRTDARRQRGTDT